MRVATSHSHAVQRLLEVLELSTLPVRSFTINVQWDKAVTVNAEIVVTEEQLSRVVDVIAKESPDVVINKTQTQYTWHMGTNP